MSKMKELDEILTVPDVIQGKMVLEGLFGEIRLRGLFRGKDILSEDWYYGGLVQETPDRYFLVQAIIKESTLAYREVAEKTICQCTGHYASNGKGKIVPLFEGDIVSYPNERDLGYGKIFWDKSKAKFYIRYERTSEIGKIDLVSSSESIVVGNIFDDKYLFS